VPMGAGPGLWASLYHSNVAICLLIGIGQAFYNYARLKEAQPGGRGPVILRPAMRGAAE